MFIFDSADATIMFRVLLMCSDESAVGLVTSAIGMESAKLIVYDCGLASIPGVILGI